VCCVQEVTRFRIRVKGVEFLEMEERGMSFGGQGEEGQERWC